MSVFRGNGAVPSLIPWVSLQVAAAVVVCLTVKQNRKDAEHTHCCFPTGRKRWGRSLLSGLAVEWLGSAVKCQPLPLELWTAKMHFNNSQTFVCLRLATPLFYCVLYVPLLDIPGISVDVWFGTLGVKVKFWHWATCFFFFFYWLGCGL